MRSFSGGPHVEVLLKPNLAFGVLLAPVSWKLSHGPLLSWNRPFRGHWASADEAPRQRRAWNRGSTWTTKKGKILAFQARFSCFGPDSYILLGFQAGFP